MCVDRMVLPSGRRTESPLLVGTMLVQGLSTRRKWLVHPESAYAVLLVGGDEYCWRVGVLLMIGLLLTLPFLQLLVRCHSLPHSVPPLVLVHVASFW